MGEVKRDLIGCVYDRFGRCIGRYYVPVIMNCESDRGNGEVMGKVVTDILLMWFLRHNI